MQIFIDKSCRPFYHGAGKNRQIERRWDKGRYKSYLGIFGKEKLVTYFPNHKGGMMKKILIFAVVLSLLAPAAVFAATEFSLGGYIKLDTFWDSTDNGKNINGAVPRNNDPSNHHGNFRMTAQGSRFNFTIKGPDVLGAKLTGFIEMDFDSCTDVGSVSNAPGGASASNNYVPRLRHAMFRMNWPGETELIFGQYWSMFCDWFPEVAEDGPFQVTGVPTARLPQIRFTQGFACDWKVAGLIGEPNNDAAFFSGNPYNTTVNNGNSTETPQIQGQLKYAHDWWGKAAFYGNPIPFTASITAGWQRNMTRFASGQTLVFSNLATTNTAQWANTYVSPWMVQGSFFIPVIPTHSNDLAGTAHLLVQPWIGQGVNAFGMAGDSCNVFKLNTIHGSTWQTYDAELLKRFGLMAEAQYYFTNQWYINAAYAITAAFNYHEPWSAAYGTVAGAVGQVRSMQQVDATLWYQPVKALKFGLQYSYAHCEYLVDAYVNGGVPQNGVAATAAQGRDRDLADEHRVEFVGFFFF